MVRWQEETWQEETWRTAPGPSSWSCAYDASPRSGDEDSTTAARQRVALGMPQSQSASGLCEAQAEVVTSDSVAGTAAEAEAETKTSLMAGSLLRLHGRWRLSLCGRVAGTGGVLPARVLYGRRSR